MTAARRVRRRPARAPGAPRASRNSEPGSDGPATVAAHVDLGAAPGAGPSVFDRAMAVLTANDPRFQQGFEAVDTSVLAGVGFYGYYGALSEGPIASSPVGVRPPWV